MKRLFSSLVAFALSLLVIAPAAHANDNRVQIVKKAAVSATAASGVASGATTSVTVTIPGALVGDGCIASHDQQSASFLLGCAITAANTATVTITQLTTNGAALSSGNLRVFLHPRETR